MKSLRLNWFPLFCTCFPSSLRFLYVLMYVETYQMNILHTSYTFRNIECMYTMQYTYTYSAEYQNWIAPFFSAVLKFIKVWGFIQVCDLQIEFGIWSESHQFSAYTCLAEYKIGNHEIETWKISHGNKRLIYFLLNSDQKLQINY